MASGGELGLLHPGQQAQGGLAAYLAGWRADKGEGGGGELGLRHVVKAEQGHLLADVVVLAHAAPACLDAVDTTEGHLGVVAEHGGHLGVLVQQLGYGVGGAALGAFTLQYPLRFEGQAVLQQAGAVAADALGAGEGVGPPADVGDVAMTLFDKVGGGLLGGVGVVRADKVHVVPIVGAGGAHQRQRRVEQVLQRLGGRAAHRVEDDARHPLA